MGQDAVEINDKLLEVIRPHFLRLRGMQVLHDRDYKTVWFFYFIFPHYLLNSTVMDRIVFIELHSN